jgi:hypothetical protein
MRPFRTLALSGFTGGKLAQSHETEVRPIVGPRALRGEIARAEAARQVARVGRSGACISKITNCDLRETARAKSIPAGSLTADGTTAGPSCRATSATSVMLGMLTIRKRGKSLPFTSFEAHDVRSQNPTPASARICLTLLPI